MSTRPGLTGLSFVAARSSSTSASRTGTRGPCAGCASVLSCFLANTTAINGGSPAELQILDATPKSVRAATDDFGNHVVDIEVPYVAEQVTFVSWSVVERNIGSPHLVASALLNDPRLLDPSKLTAPDEALEELIHKLRLSGLQQAELATAACQEVFGLMTYAHGVTTVRTTAAEAFAQRQGVCQDYAHVLLAITRGLGLPSRYVSGQLLGTGGSHAWVEVLVPDVSGRARVLALDPTTGRGAGMTYVTIAVGRDYADIAPVSGTYLAPHSGVLTMSKRAVVRRVEGSTGPDFGRSDGPRGLSAVHRAAGPVSAGPDPCRGPVRPAGQLDTVFGRCRVIPAHLLIHRPVEDADLVAHHGHRRPQGGSSAHQIPFLVDRRPRDRSER